MIPLARVYARTVERLCYEDLRPAQRWHSRPVDQGRQKYATRARRSPSGNPGARPALAALPLALQRRMMISPPSRYLADCR